MNIRKQKQERTHKAIIAAAAELWAQPGSYDAVTTRMIARLAGVSTGAIFNRWDSKDDLWREAMGYEPPKDSAIVRRALKAQAEGIDVRV